MRYNINTNLGEFEFFQVPKSIQNETYKDLSIQAKWLYMLLYDTNKLSIKNKWYDENGDVFIYYTVDKIMEELKVGNKLAVKIKKELVNHNLIEEKRQGLGKPNKIYVTVLENTKKCQNDISRIDEKTNQDTSKEHTNNNKNNNNELNNNIYSHLSPNVDGVLKNDNLDDVKGSNNVTDVATKHKEAREIFEFWNELESTITHTDKNFQPKLIETALKKFGKSELLSAMKRMNMANLDKKYFYSNRWNLYNFLKQRNGVPNWLDEGQEWNRFKDSRKVVESDLDNKITNNITLTKPALETQIRAEKKELDFI